MTLFGYLVVLLYVGNFILSLIKKIPLNKIFLTCLAISCCIEINNVSGFLFLSKNGFEFEYSEFGLAFTAIVGFLLLILTKAKINRKVFWGVATFIISIIIGLALEILFPVDAKIIDYSLSWDRYIWGLDKMHSVVISAQSTLFLLRCLIFIIIMIAAKCCLNKDEQYEKIISFMLTTMKLHLLFCLFEWITKNIFNSDISSVIQSYIMHEGKSTYIGLYLRGGKAALQGLTREPAYLSITLYFFICINLLSGKINQNILWILLALFIWFNSGSFGSVVYICILVLLYVTYKGINQTIDVSKLFSKFIMTFIIFTVFIVCLYYIVTSSEYLSSRFANVSSVINAILNNNVTYLNISSESARLYGIYYTVHEVLLSRPLFGFGIGTAYASSGIACVLGQIGILGFVAWYNMINKFSINNVETKHKFNYLFLIAYIFPNLILNGFNMLYVSYILPLIYICSKD